LTKLSTSTRGRISRIRSWFSSGHPSEQARLESFGQIASGAAGSA
jgi:hypothetical protein